MISTRCIVSNCFHFPDRIIRIVSLHAIVSIKYIQHKNAAGWKWSRIMLATTIIIPEQYIAQIYASKFSGHVLVLQHYVTTANMVIIGEQANRWQNTCWTNGTVRIWQISWNTTFTKAMKRQLMLWGSQVGYLFIWSGMDIIMPGLIARSSSTSVICTFVIRSTGFKLHSLWILDSK